MYTTICPQNKEFEFLIEFFRLSILDIIVEPVNSKAKFLYPLLTADACTTTYLIQRSSFFVWLGCCLLLCVFVYFHCYESLTDSNHIISVLSIFFFYHKDTFTIYSISTNVGSWMDASLHLVTRLYRSSENTNQRILFDIDPSGQHLGTGGQVSWHSYYLATSIIVNQY